MKCISKKDFKITEIPRSTKICNGLQEINALTYNRKGVHKDKTYRRDLDPYSCDSSPVSFYRLCPVSLLLRKPRNNQCNFRQIIGR